MAKYTLTKEDKALLKRWGYPRQDQAQIEEAINRSTYKLEDSSGEKVITKDKAIEVLGKETFLSGISRSAFHFTCSRNPEDNPKIRVSFDSSILFK